MNHLGWRPTIVAQADPSTKHRWSSLEVWQEIQLLGVLAKTCKMFRSWLQIGYQSYWQKKVLKTTLGPYV